MPSFTCKNNEKIEVNDDHYSSNIKVGGEFQAEIPEMMSRDQYTKPLKEMPIWGNDHKLNNSQVQDFVKLAKDKHHYITEQALVLLHANKYDLNQSLHDLSCYKSNVLDFSEEEKMLYEQNFNIHRKDFSQYTSLSHRPIKELVLYYYLHKITLSKQFPNKKKNKRARVDADSEYKRFADQRGPGPDGSPNCVICLQTYPDMFGTRIGNLCQRCYDEKKDDGSLEDGDYEYDSSKSDPAQEMEYYAENLSELTDEGITNLNNETEDIDRSIREKKQEVQNKRQKINHDHGPPISSSRIVPRWSEEDIASLGEALKEWGPDLRKIAALLGNKNEEQVRQYLLANKEKYKDFLPDDGRKDMDVDSV